MLESDVVKIEFRKKDFKKSKREEIEVPDQFMEALDRNKYTKEAFEKMSPSHKREYLKWIIEAKKDETRDKRIKKAINQISELRLKH